MKTAGCAWTTAALMAVAACGGSGRAAPVHGGAHGTLADVACDGDVPSGARCATLWVLENRTTRSGRTIPLGITIVPPTARVAAPDPVFFLAGGPGQAAAELMQMALRSGVHRTRTIVLADQRGTGRSNGFECRFYGPPDNPQGYFTEFLPPAKVRVCREELAPRADLTQYTTAASVDDLEDIRTALAYETINLHGGSYGTRLAMEYVRKYERRVRSVVLDGPVPPSAPMPEDFGKVAQQGLDALLDECARSAACAAAFPAIRQDAQSVFDRLQRGPVTVTLAHPDGSRSAAVALSRNHVGEAIRYMMYVSRSAGDVPLFLHEAARGNFVPIATFLIRHRRSGTFDGLYLSITCAEDVPFVSGGAEARDEPTYLGGYRIREQRAACEDWPRGAEPPWRGQPVRASVPVLILSGQLDPVTPPSFGHELARTLTNSRHLSVPFGGHSRYGLIGLECLDAAVARFVERADFQELDATCVANVTRPPFSTPR
jgi:pimeloyl-ACP methyl ester carboxylesterase